MECLMFVAIPRETRLSKVNEKKTRKIHLENFCFSLTLPPIQMNANHHTSIYTKNSNQEQSRKSHFEAFVE